MNALLVCPRVPVTYRGFEYRLQLIGKRAALPPLGLITVANLLPADWRIRLVDPNPGVLRDDDPRRADIVLTVGTLVQTESMQKVIARVRAFGRPVVVGGPAPTTSPGLPGDADVLFRGEAEGRIAEMVSALAERTGGRLVRKPRVTTPEQVADRGFPSVSIGIETPSVEPVEQATGYQNLSLDSNSIHEKNGLLRSRDG